MDVKKYTCIICPMGCEITLTADGNKIVEVVGNTCKRGENFAKNEYKNPLRTITTVIRLKNSNYRCLPVISNGGIPKDQISNCLNLLKTKEAKAPIKMGDVIIEDILSTGVDIIAAKSVK